MRDPLSQEKLTYIGSCQHSQIAESDPKEALRKTMVLSIWNQISLSKLYLSPGSNGGLRRNLPNVWPLSLKKSMKVFRTKLAGHSTVERGDAIMEDEWKPQQVKIAVVDGNLTKCACVFEGRRGMGWREELWWGRGGNRKVLRPDGHDERKNCIPFMRGFAVQKWRRGIMWLWRASFILSAAVYSTSTACLLCFSTILAVGYGRPNHARCQGSRSDCVKVRESPPCAGTYDTRTALVTY